MRAVIASILLLLTSVSVAHAECAWVLWERQFAPGSPPLDTWVIRAAWPDWKACKVEEEKSIVDQVATKPPEVDAKVNRFGNTVNAQVGMRLLWSFKFVCLPDP
jgi:hypothetical protein